MYFRADTAFVVIGLAQGEKKYFSLTPGILIRNSNLTTVLLFKKTNKKHVAIFLLNRLKDKKILFWRFRNT